MANAVVTTTSLQALAYCRRRRTPLQQQQAADTILLQLKARGGQGTRPHGSTTYCHFVNSHQSEHKVCPAQSPMKSFLLSSLLPYVASKVLGFEIGLSNLLYDSYLVDTKSSLFEFSPY